MGQQTMKAKCQDKVEIVFTFFFHILFLFCFYYKDILLLVTEDFIFSLLLGFKVKLNSTLLKFCKIIASYFGPRDDTLFRCKPSIFNFCICELRKYMYLFIY